MVMGSSRTKEVRSEVIHHILEQPTNANSTNMHILFSEHHHNPPGGGTCIGPETRVLTTQEPTSDNENSTVIQIKDLCNKPKPATFEGDILDASH